MFYYLYEIKNLVNSKIYIGVHQSSFLNDNYMGSGKVIKLAIKKYGKEKFKKTVLCFFETREEMFEVEKLIIDEKFISRLDTYNVKIGGEGGFDYINKNSLGLRTGAVWTDKSRKIMSDIKRGKSTITENGRKLLSKNNGMKSEEAKTKIRNSLKNKSKSEEHKRKISEAIKAWHKSKNA